MSEQMYEEIKARELDWADAFNANDAQRLASIYEQDAVLIAPNMPPLIGRKAIEEALPNFFPVFRNVTLIVDEIRPIGENHAVVVGHSTQQVATENGSWNDAVNNYQVVYHKGADGVWYYATDMFNPR